MYGKYTNTTSSPADEVFLITPSNTPLAILPKAIRADSAGTITFRASGSATSVTLNLQAGEVLAVRPIIVSAATAVIHGLA
jgi:hypothetical protein